MGGAQRGLFVALRLEKIAMFIVLTFIALVASFSIISTLHHAGHEKGREVAILKSMGARRRAPSSASSSAEGLYIGLLGLAFGVALGIGGSSSSRATACRWTPTSITSSKLPVVMRGGEIAAVGLAALALCCLATVYPALVASRMRPVEGLRYE